MRKKVKMMAVLIMATAMTIGATSCETQAEKEAKAEAAKIEAEKAAKEAQPAKYTITIGKIGTTFLDVIAYECDDSLSGNHSASMMEPILISSAQTAFSTQSLSEGCTPINFSHEG